MLTLGTLAFAAPWVLLALAGIPILWWLLRVTPPSPKLVQFPAIRLLLRLQEKEDTPARTPWWLLLLRIIIVLLLCAVLLVREERRLRALPDFDGPEMGSDPQ